MFNFDLNITGYCIQLISKIYYFNQVFYYKYVTNIHFLQENLIYQQDKIQIIQLPNFHLITYIPNENINKKLNVYSNLHIT